MEVGGAGSRTNKEATGLRPSERGEEWWEGVRSEQDTLSALKAAPAVKPAERNRGLALSSYDTHQFSPARNTFL